MSPVTPEAASSQPPSPEPASSSALDINPGALDPDDTETLADLILAAYRDASAQAPHRHQSTMGPLARGSASCRGCDACTKELSKTSSTSSVDFRASAQSLLSASPSICWRPIRSTSRDSLRCFSRSRRRFSFCRICGNVAEATSVEICQDPRRDLAVICVVEESKDVVAVERTREFRGRYHVLGGAISPIEGIGPDDLRVKELMTRLADGTVTELIIATDPNLEGEATATYLARLVKPMGLTVSRLASGLPVGGDLEYADEVTLGRAFEGRRSLEV